MFTVTESARTVEVTPDTVRHYVHIGILSSERNAHNGYKYFLNEDIHKLKSVSQAKSLGFNLTEINDILDNAKRGDRQCHQVREIIQQRIQENRSKLAEINTLQERMGKASKLWKGMPDCQPDRGSICH